MSICFVQFEVGCSALEIESAEELDQFRHAVREAVRLAIASINRRPIVVEEWQCDVEILLTAGTLAPPDGSPAAETANAVSENSKPASDGGL